MNPYEPPQAEPDSQLGADDAQRPTPDLLPPKLAGLLFGLSGFPIRLPVVLVVLAGFCIVADRATGADPFLCGPLGLTQGGGTILPGQLFAAACLAAVGSLGVWPRWYTCLLALLGCAAWLAAGAYVAIGYAR